MILSPYISMPIDLDLGGVGECVDETSVLIKTTVLITPPLKL